MKSHRKTAPRAELAISVQGDRRRAGVSRVNETRRGGSEPRAAAAALGNLVLLCGFSYPDCAIGVVTLIYCRYFLILKYPQSTIQAIWG